MKWRIAILALIGVTWCTFGTTPAKSQMNPSEMVRAEFTECPHCDSKARKRVAVMPVEVANLGAELELPPEQVGQRVRNQLEAKLSESETLIVLNRSRLDAVIAEQQLSQSGAFNRELAPKVGRLIPAQFTLNVWVEHLNMRRDEREEMTSTAKRFYEQAQAKQREAEQALDNAQRTQSMLSQLEAQLAQAKSQAQSYASSGASSGGVVVAAVGLATGEYQVNKARANYNQYMNIHRDAQRESQRLMQKAQYEAEQRVTKTVQRTAEIRVGWRATDTMTGQVAYSGADAATDNDTSTGTSVKSSFSSSRRSSSTRDDVLVNKVIDMVIGKIVGSIDGDLADEPLRPKVVKASSHRVVISAGENYGVRVGDTFGVRQKSEGLVDPDTGLQLAEPGPPKGLIRIFQVHEEFSEAQIIKSAGALDRGDQLEWIGVYYDAAQARAIVDDEMEKARKNAETEWSATLRTAASSGLIRFASPQVMSALHVKRPADVETATRRIFQRDSPIKALPDETMGGVRTARSFGDAGDLDMPAGGEVRERIAGARVVRTEHGIRVTWRSDDDDELIGFIVTKSTGVGRAIERLSPLIPADAREQYGFDLSDASVSPESLAIQTVDADLRVQDHPVRGR